MNPLSQDLNGDGVVNALDTAPSLPRVQLRELMSASAGDGD